MQGLHGGAAQNYRIGQAIIAAAALLALAKFALPDFMIRPPEWLVWPFADWINWLFTFVKDDLGLIYATRAFASAIEWLLDVTTIGTATEQASQTILQP